MPPRRLVILPEGKRGASSTLPRRGKCVFAFPPHKGFTWRNNLPPSSSRCIPLASASPSFLRRIYWRSERTPPPLFLQGSRVEVFSPFSSRWLPFIPVGPSDRGTSPPYAVSSPHVTAGLTGWGLCLPSSAWPPVLLNKAPFPSRFSGESLLSVGWETIILPSFQSDLLIERLLPPMQLVPLTWFVVRGSPLLLSGEPSPPPSEGFYSRGEIRFFLPPFDFSSTRISLPPTGGSSSFQGRIRLLSTDIVYSLPLDSPTSGRTPNSLWAGIIYRTVFPFLLSLLSWLSLWYYGWFATLGYFSFMALVVLLVSGSALLCSQQSFLVSSYLVRYG